MNLEDHVGDVVRKARMMCGVTPTAVARAAGLSDSDLAAFEDSGLSPGGIDLAAVAALLGLHAVKLRSLARGWLPAVPDLAQWRELRQISTVAGSNTVHCYLAWDEVTREAALFDTGWDAAPVLDLIDREQVVLKHLFITHTHTDHTAGIPALRARWPKLLLHTDSPTAPPQYRNRRNDCIPLGSLRITHRPTPGHAPDGVTYIIGNWPDDVPHAAMVGDALFAGSMGGAPQHGATAKQAVREQILSLPASTLLCPGHGPLTTVAEEKAQNPFF